MLPTHLFVRLFFPFNSPTTEQSTTSFTLLCLTTCAFNTIKFRSLKMSQPLLQKQLKPPLRSPAGDVNEEQRRKRRKQRTDTHSDKHLARRPRQKVSSSVAYHRDYTMGLNDQNGHTDPRSHPREAGVDYPMMVKHRSQYNTALGDEADDEATPEPEPSSLAIGQPVTHPPHFRACVACDVRLPFFQLARCPCSHEYCGGCLERLFTAAVAIEDSWPLRCCQQPIPAEKPEIRIFLSGQLIRRYLARKLEMETPNRIYCYKPDCSEFISPANIKHGTGTCSRCGSELCIICREAAHDERDCPKDEATQQLMALAGKEGWKQCNSCNRMIERTDGCNHISKSRFIRLPSPSYYLRSQR